MEILFEIVFGVWTELMLLVVPEEKSCDKKYRALAVALAILSIFGVLALLIWGCILLFEKDNDKGAIPIIIAGVISVAQIIAGLILYKR